MYDCYDIFRCWILKEVGGWRFLGKCCLSCVIAGHASRMCFMFTWGVEIKEVFLCYVGVLELR